MANLEFSASPRLRSFGDRVKATPSTHTFACQVVFVTRKKHFPKNLIFQRNLIRGNRSSSSPTWTPR